MAKWGGNFLSNLLVLDNKNFDYWVIMMEVIIGFYEEVWKLWEMVSMSRMMLHPRKKIARPIVCFINMWIWWILEKYRKQRYQRRLGTSCRRQMEVLRRPRRWSSSLLKGNMNFCPCLNKKHWLNISIGFNCW